uniref:Uncharacterized protein n=1 Tax=Ditylenchus dipsaci TaxID=166011 RepID=A0A915ETN6_9BILA
MFQPDKFEGSEERMPVNVNSPAEVSFLDCSSLYLCFPCSAISLRSCCRSICPGKGCISLRQFASCECIRPTIHGSVPTVDFICCMV